MKRSSAGKRRSTRPLAGRIALVAGATVYCTGRSVRGKPSPYGRTETIEETAELVEAAGGVGVALRIDHTVETEVRRLFKRIDSKHGRLDVVVNCIAGEDPLMGQWASFWEVDARNADAILRQAFTSHVITAKYAAQRMIAARRGLIVEITESDTLGAGGNPFSQAVKVALKAFALNMATELKQHRVAALAVTPGFLRSESMLERFGVTEQNWRDGGKRDSNFLVSESPLYVGRAVAALAADRNVLARTGQLWSSWQLARDYGFTDADGRRPDWGRHDIDFGDHPGGLLEYIRTGCELQRDWLANVSRHTRSLLKQLPAA